MALYVEDLIWNEENIEHIADHRVRPQEVEDVIWDTPLFEKRRGPRRYHVYGQTSGGRYLFIVLDREHDAVFYVVTARDMEEQEKGYYRRRKR
jgi:uncharacterized DUF497 family protein